VIEVVYLFCSSVVGLMKLIAAIWLLSRRGLVLDHTKSAVVGASKRVLFVEWGGFPRWSFWCAYRRRPITTHHPIWSDWFPWRLIIVSYCRSCIGTLDPKQLCHKIDYGPPLIIWCIFSRNRSIHFNFSLVVHELLKLHLEKLLFLFVC